jgi:hypothetical protein
MMIAQNEDDPSAHVENSLMFYYQLKRAGDGYCACLDPIIHLHSLCCSSAALAVLFVCCTRCAVRLLHSLCCSSAALVVLFVCNPCLLPNVVFSLRLLFAPQAFSPANTKAPS